MAIRKLAGAVAVVLSLVLLTSCDKPSRPPLVFGAKTAPAYEPLYLARELGYLPTDQVRLAEYANTGEVALAFRNHSVHLAGVTLEEALTLRRDVPDLKIVLVLGQSRSAGQVLDVVVARDEDIGDYHREMGQLAQGWARALDYLRTAPEKATQMMAKHEHLEAAQFEKAMQEVELFGVQRNRELMLGDNPGIDARINATQRMMLDKGLLSVGVEPSLLLDASLLTGIAP